VAYILTLIAGLNPNNSDYKKERQQILDTMVNDSQMRNKAVLIDDFIKENIDNNKVGFEKSKADGSIDLENRLNEFIQKKRNLAIHKLANEEDIEATVLSAYIIEYDYLQREKPEIIQEAVKQKKVGLRERRTIMERVSQEIRNNI